MDGMQREAVISPCGRYRYCLTREWDASASRRGAALFVMLNPSTADASHDDPTIRRCIAYAKAWGFGRLSVGNLFALRATDPHVMLASKDPVGPDNDAALLSMAAESPLVIAAWGAMGGHEGRDRVVGALLPSLHALRLTRDGQPCHPLYLPARLTPFPFIPHSAVKP